MKKSLLVLLLLSATLFAQSGMSIYKKYCLSCHIMSDAKLDGIDRSTLKAPPMNRVSERLKMKTNSKKEFVAFAKDYIVNPSQKKGFCRPKAYKHFGVMPPIGKALSKEQLHLISTWLYTHYKGKNNSGKSCANPRGKKAQSSKCGGKQKKMKCGSGKCGGK